MNMLSFQVKKIDVGKRQPYAYPKTLKAEQLFHTDANEVSHTVNTVTGKISRHSLSATEQEIIIRDQG
jgi:CxxC motif-containing protein (DUF1111 family)